MLSAEENIEFILQLLGRPEGGARARAREVLAEVGLAGLEARRPRGSPAASSSASRWRGRWRPKPAIVLADEPTANLDSRTPRS